jgi:DNA-binding NarL/FixJ family response regulator
MARTAIVPDGKARILVVDDHPVVRSGVIHLINQQVDLVCCGEAGSLSEAQEVAAACRPDLAVIDLRLRGGDGLELTRALRAQFPDLCVLILSQYDASLYIERALRAGASGYVAKEQPPEQLLEAIRTALAGDVYLARGTAARLLHTFFGPTPNSPRAGVRGLSDRELHVLHLLGAGMSTREVATELSLSFKTIETHRENIKRKLGLRGAADLIHYAADWAREQICLPAESVQGAVRSEPWMHP